MTEKLLALSLFLEILIDDISESSYDDCIFDAGGNEYLVCTDEEADQKWEESLDSYLDDCILPELGEILQCYFDRDGWKRDAKMDGRGHSLSHYDGNEDEFSTIKNEEYLFELLAEFYEVEADDIFAISNDKYEKLLAEFLDHYDIALTNETFYIYRLS